MGTASFVQPRADLGALDLRLKVVPGASRSAIAGRLGDRLKVRVAAPPEGGKANRAVCALIAEWLGVGESSVTVVAGAGAAEKTVRVSAACAIPDLE